MSRVLLLLFVYSCVWGSDWLMIQGTEPSMILVEGDKQKNTWDTPQLWGFAQLKYEKNYSSVFESGGIDKTGFAYVAPDLQDQEQVQLFRARLGLRGVLDDENKINYFTLTDFGKNGISEPLGHSQNTYIVDASLTFRYIPYANIRIGLFKYPGSEEGLQARFASPFILFTNMTNNLLLEKIPTTSKDELNTNGSYLNQPEGSVGAFRDTGIELFDRFGLDEDWALSYALMLGNGSGLEWENRNQGEYTGYGYLALQKDFHKGKGYYHQDLKTYLWYQEGKRAMDADNQTRLYDRIRYGAGVRYYKEGLRLEAEYTGAKGMIVAGAKDVNPGVDARAWHLALEAEKENRANGYYLSAAYEFYPGMEVLARYERLNNLNNDAAKKRVFETTTLGVSYRFYPGTRLDLNYLIRDAQAPSNPAAQGILDNMENVLIFQLTYKFGWRL